MSHLLPLRRGEAALLAGGGVVLVVLTVGVVLGGPVPDADGRVHSWVVTHVATGTVSTLAALGDIGVSGSVLAVAALVTAHSAMRLWPLALAAGAPAAMAVVVLLLKAAVGRGGPGLSAPGGAAGYFPSGHTATAGVCLGTAAYLLWSLRNRSAAAVVGLAVGSAAAAVEGALTVLAGYHWLSDAIGGLAVTTVVLVVAFAVRRATASTAGPGRRD